MPFISASILEEITFNKLKKKQVDIHSAFGVTTCHPVGAVCEPKCAFDDSYTDFTLYILTLSLWKHIWSRINV